MKLGDLPPTERRQSLRTGSLLLRTGPFVYRLRSDLADTAEALGRLYADFPLARADSFADFPLTLARGRTLPPRWRLLMDGRPLFGPFPRPAATAYLEWGLNRCVSRHAHRHLILHAAVVEKHGRALILAGRAATGKSTLAALLAARGWRLLSDEMALLSPADGRLAPLARPVCLKGKSIALVRRAWPAAEFGPTAVLPEEGAVAHLRPPADSVARMAERPLPAWLVLTARQPGSASALRPVEKGEAARQAIQCSFNYKLLGERGYRALAALVERCRCRALRFDDATPAAAALDALAEAGP